MSAVEAAVFATFEVALVLAVLFVAVLFAATVRAPSVVVVAERYGAKVDAIASSSKPIDLNVAIKSLVASFPPKTS